MIFTLEVRVLPTVQKLTINKNRMNKLEEKHLCKFLPYSLKYLKPATTSASIFTRDKKETIETMGRMSMMAMINNDNMFPILQPLDNLGIGNHGKNLLNLLIEKGLYKNTYGKGYEDYTFKIVRKPFGKVFKIANHDDWVLMLSFDETFRCKYLVYEYLLENHFDVDNLIGQNLAVNYNRVYS
jgi:hypothetical protein